MTVKRLLRKMTGMLVLGSLLVLVMALILTTDELPFLEALIMVVQGLAVLAIAVAWGGVGIWLLSD